MTDLKRYEPISIDGNGHAEEAPDGDFVRYEDYYHLHAKVAQLTAALAPLVAIADAFDANDLDDEARKFWGQAGEHENTTPPAEIELYAGRGGARLLTLADALAARAAIQ